MTLEVHVRRLFRRIFGRGMSEAEEGEALALELPWERSWYHVPRRSAGHDFDRDDYRRARANAREICRTTLGDELWEQLQRDGYLDLPSNILPGISYRLKVGWRIEVVCEPGARSPWRYPFLCINPAYPLPEEEFFAQLYLYVRDDEREVIRVAAPQPWNQQLGRTF